MKRFLIAFLLFAVAVPVKAGPFDFFTHPIRTIERHPVATAFVFAGGSAAVHAFGLHHCREDSVENCQAKYGAAWMAYGFATGTNLVVIAATKDCWGKEKAAFCSVFQFGGSAGQLGFGIAQYTKKGPEFTLHPEKD